MSENFQLHLLKCWYSEYGYDQNLTESNSNKLRGLRLYCMHLLKMHIKLIIILLVNDLTNICSEISKIRFILWMVYTCNVKGLEEVEKLGRNECTLHR